MFEITDNHCHNQPVMKMDLKLKVLTLNCWGIVGVSRHRKERMAAIAAHIATSDYDFVFLQEVWSKKDFKLIQKKSASVLPYAHYFYSGVIGSGVCILSRSCIVDSAQYPYSLNGFAHKVLHGDWFGGKLVGLCKVIHHGLKINLYVTHLHAEYDSVHDQYLPHRIVQSFEFSQFVKLTSDSADVSIIAGDFNTESTDLPYQVIIHNIGCVDSFLSSPKFKETNNVFTTCGHPDNMYTTQQELKDCPTGKRIDYIMYKCGTGTSIKCLTCETSLGKINDTSIPYSDHEAVISELHVFKSAEEIMPMFEVNPQAKLDALNGSVDILSKSIRDLRFSRHLYFLACVLFIVAFFTSVAYTYPGMYHIFNEIIQVISVIAFVFCIWMATVMNSMEYNALFNASKSMHIIINRLICDHGFQLPIKPVEGLPEHQNTI